jgi:hypothetical protein
VAVTYGAVLVGGVVFRAATPRDAGSILAGMVGLHGLGSVPDDPRTALNALWIAALYGIIWLAPTTRQFMLPQTDGRLAWAPTGRWAVAMGCAATLGLLAAGGTGEFVYFRF